jgi:hypothetical protein
MDTRDGVRYNYGNPEVVDKKTKPLNDCNRSGVPGPPTKEQPHLLVLNH